VAITPPVDLACSVLVFAVPLIITAEVPWRHVLLTVQLSPDTPPRLYARSM